MIAFPYMRIHLTIIMCCTLEGALEEGGGIFISWSSQNVAHHCGFLQDVFFFFFLHLHHMHLFTGIISLLMSDNLLRPINRGWKLIFLFKLRLKAGMVHSQYILSMFMSMFFLLARLKSYYSQHFCNSLAFLVTVPWKLAKMCMPHYPFHCTLPSLLLLFLSFHTGFSLPDWHGTLFSPGCQCLIQTFGSESLSPRRFGLSSSLPSLHSLQAIISSLCVQARLSSFCECCLVCVCVACASSESQWWRGGCVSEPTWETPEAAVFLHTHTLMFYIYSLSS